MSKQRPTILLHGIRTTGAWQKEFGDELSRHRLEHQTFDYGRFSSLKFALQSMRREKIDQFYQWYTDKRSRVIRNPKRYRDFRPSVVAHSFGTYIVGYAMTKYPDLTLGRLILCGSILPTHFDWPTLFSRNQLFEVQNDYSSNDIWSRRVRLLVRDAGPSGASGFDIKSPLVRDRLFKYHSHSDYFKSGHYEQWVDSLSTPLVQFRTVRSSDLRSMEEWLKIAQQTRHIDSLVYNNLDGYDHAQLPEGLSTRWLQANPDIYSILIDQKNRVHGYLNAMPLTDMAFSDVVTGRRGDHEIAPADIVTYKDDTDVNLYLMSIAIHPDSRRLADGPEQSAFHRLLFALIHRLEMLARDRRIFVKKLGAVGWTDEGKRLCELFGMQLVHADKYAHPTYELDMRTINRRVHPSLQRLLAVYAECRS